jgi:hypothetical protein
MTVPLLLVGLIVGLLLQPWPSMAQGPAPPGEAPIPPAGSGFTYQGRLRDGDGNPIDNTCDLAFSLWDAESGGSQVGSDSTVTGVAVTEGYFTVVVNGGGEFGADAFTGAARWLEVAIRCSGDSNPITLDPRQVLNAAPYALSLQPGAIISGTVVDGNSLTVMNDDANGRAVYGFATGSGGWPVGLWGESDATSGTGVTGWASATSGTVEGVYGVTASTEGSGVFGYAGAAEGETNGVYGLATSTEGRGVYGYASSGGGYTYGVYGQSGSTDGVGVRGEATATTGSPYGVAGRSSAPNGYGVFGWNGAASGGASGVYGQSASTSGHGVFGWATASSGTTYGVYGWANSAAGSGVFGYASASSGPAYGVYGQSASTSGSAVYGYASASSGITRGVLGQSASTDGVGVHGRAGSTSGYTTGVYGWVASTGGVGVVGYATANSGTTYGVRGVSDSTSGYGVSGEAWATSGTAYGVIGETESPDGYGVYYIGGLGGSGLKSSTVKTEDYGWRQLYSMESPDVLFEDVGTAQLIGGRAEVAIDTVFAQTVNMEAPYQVFLTPLGDCGLYVAEQTPTTFTVRALNGSSCSIAFHYRIVAKRLGYEDRRLAPAVDPEIAAGRVLESDVGR